MARLTTSLGSETHGRRPIAYHDAHLSDIVRILIRDLIKWGLFRGRILRSGSRLRGRLGFASRRRLDFGHRRRLDFSPYTHRIITATAAQKVLDEPHAPSGRSNEGAKSEMITIGNHQILGLHILSLEAQANSAIRANF